MTTPEGRTPDEVRRALAERIGSGQLRPGQRLGAERALAAELGVSRATLRQALAVLEEGGVVRRVPGRGGGTFVAKGKIERDLSRIVGVPAPDGVAVGRGNVGGNPKTCEGEPLGHRYAVALGLCLYG
jgi:DNA-binding FadR family transcriptional regulator